MSTSAQHVSGLRSAPQATFGAVLFVAWAIESFFWVYATIHSVADGDIAPLITAVAALALLVLLFGMEGLEVAVIDRWRSMYPERLCYSRIHRQRPWPIVRETCRTTCSKDCLRKTAS